MAMTSTTTSGSTPSGGGSGGSGVKHGTQVVKEHAGAVAGSAKDEAGNVMRSATEHARSVVGSAGDELRDQSRTQTDRLAQTLDRASHDLAHMADQGEGDSPSTRLVRSMADATGQLARRLGDGGPEGMVEDVSRFARRRPGAFLLASAAAGFAVGRLARSSDTRAITQAVRSDGDADRTGPTGVAAGSPTPSSALPSDMPPPPTGAAGGLGDTAPNASTGVAGTSRPMDSSALPPTAAPPTSATDPSVAEAASPADGGGR